MSNEALRLADSIHEMNNAAYVTAIANLNEKNRQQAERIAELEAERDNLHTTMFAAAVAIQSHWDAHCDAEGYGPSHLMHRLERGVAALYGYDAATLQRVETERDQLRAEVERTSNNRDMWKGQCERQAEQLAQMRAKVERLNPNAERWEWVADGDNFDEVFALLTDPKLTTYELTRAVDAARTRKETK